MSVLTFDGQPLTFDGQPLTFGEDEMANDVEITAGAGTPVATDEVGGRHFQVVKLVDGTEGGTERIAGDAANGLDVDVTRSALPTGAATAANQATVIGHLDGVEGLLATIDADTGALAGAVAGTEVQVDVVAMPNVTVGNFPATQPVSAASLPLPTGAATLAEQQTQTTSLGVMDDWDESDRAKVNPIAGQAGVQGGSGTANALTQRVVLATDVALPSGTNAIGKLSANSGVDIGDVGVTVSGAPTDRSVTITTGGTAQQAAASLSTRIYLFVQNPVGSGGTLWVSFLTTAVQASPSIEIPPGLSWENPAHFCPTGAVSVIHPTTNAKITVVEA